MGSRLSPGIAAMSRSARCLAFAACCSETEGCLRANEFLLHYPPANQLPSASLRESAIRKGPVLFQLGVGGTSGQIHLKCWLRILVTGGKRCQCVQSTNRRHADLYPHLPLLRYGPDESKSTLLSELPVTRDSTKKLPDNLRADVSTAPSNSGHQCGW